MEKLKYIAPTIEIIELDNEISLAMESNPPAGPDEANLQTPEFYQYNPLKDYLG